MPYICITKLAKIKKSLLYKPFVNHSILGKTWVLDLRILAIGEKMIFRVATLSLTNEDLKLTHGL